MDITQFSIFKVKEPTSDPKDHTHYISAKVGEGYVSVGVCWTKENQFGKYLSCALNKPFNNKPGYAIKGYRDEYQSDPSIAEEIEQAKSRVTDKEMEKPSDIPF